MSDRNFIRSFTNAHYLETLTKIAPAKLKSIDLRRNSEDPDYESECYISSETVGSDKIEIVFFPECQRAGIGSGSDAIWIDATSAADALRIYLNPATIED